ncbi:MAG: hypothetical protein ACOYOU_13465 [Kiritimatiellia bacterium]
MNAPRNRHNPRSGQAMIELMIGVITMLILLVGSVLFLLVSDAHTYIDSGIRGRTGFLAMSPLITEDIPRYIRTWLPGADGQRFTADDRAECVAPLAVQMIARRSVQTEAQWRELDDLRRPSSLRALHETPVPLISMGFIGIRRSAVLPVPEFAQDLFYPNPTVTVQEDVWVPIMNGLY